MRGLSKEIRERDIKGCDLKKRDEKEESEMEFKSKKRAKNKG